MFAVVVVLQFVLCSCAKKESIVYPSLLEERKAGTNLVLKVNDDITLNLERSSALADQLVFVTSAKERHHVERVNTSYIQKSLYHDTHRQSSVMVRNVEGAVEVEGILGTELRIKPLREGQRFLEGRIPHIVYEVEKKADYAMMGVDAPPELESRQGRRRKTTTSNKTKKHDARKPHAKGDAFVVEIHVISDKAHQQSFRKNEELIGYIAVMTNAVNLRFLDMVKPKVSFILVGITRSEDDPFAKHIKGGYLEAGPTLEGLGKYKAEGRVPGNPDVLFMVTGLDMVRMQDGEMHKGVAGLAFIGTVCKKNNIGESEDTATTYSGIHAMAHELCHVMGSPHDTTPECPWEEGYLMSYVDGGLKNFRLSPCSEKLIRGVYKKLPPECVDVSTETNYMSKHKKYPGQTVREVHICKKRFNKPGKKWFTRRNFQLNKECKMNCCYTEQYRTTCWKVKLLAGMSCGEGKTCKRGVCGAHKYP
ncbi:venom metalloproteinase antarease-like TtrivMP_A [Rhipicephalus sanguineus]|uniref:venom metalloproteinase antarease-like TtrivMP_A n=1 Tax=Rhipicephalus sanguineus TaxID=34632 RepID=UPI0020C2B8DC|nr:venom metalloproteinase antarease-like TtrivMP_A [Rhipicephalus sanguineus]